MLEYPRAYHAPGEPMQVPMRNGSGSPRHRHGSGQTNEFAQAIAAAGVLTASGVGLDASPDDRIHHLQWIVQASREVVEWKQPRWDIQRDVSALAAAWRAAVCDLRRVPRLEVTARGSQPTLVPDLSLLNLLSRPAVAAGSVYIPLPEPDAEASFNWPLRLGFLDDGASKQLAEDVLAERWLAELVVRVGAEEQPDLLVIPHDAPGAIAAMRATTRRTADCVVILGGLGDVRYLGGRKRDSLRNEVSTAGIAILNATVDAYPQALYDLIAEISHDTYLDEALFLAGRERQRTPLLLATRALLEQARVTRFGRRLGLEVAALGDAHVLASDVVGRELAGPARDVGRDLAMRIEQFDYTRERYGAHALGAIRRQMAPYVGDPMRPLRAEPAPQPPRYLQAEVHDARGHRMRSPLMPAVDYTLCVTIAPRPRLQTGAAVAETAVDERLLEPSTAGHELTVVFSQAPRTGEQRWAQVSRLHLPPTGAPDRGCEFTIRAEAGDRALEGRITVLYRNRVLQTARVLARVRSVRGQAALDLRLAVIEVERADAAAEREPFDASLVLNDTDFGPTVTTVAGDEAVVRNIGNLKSVLDTISKVITRFTEQERDAGGLTKGQLAELLMGLAWPGSQLWSYLRADFPDAVLRAHRIQVIEAALGAMLPVELFYRMPGPKPGATLCEGGPPERDRPCSKCPDPAHASSTVCPNQFWGFRTVVERRGLKLDVPLGAVALLKAAKTPAVPLPLKAVVYGTSSVVDDVIEAQGATPDQYPTAQARRALEDLVGEANVFQVENLDQWAEAVKSHSPGLIVFLVHKTEYIGNEALQLGSEYKFPSGSILGEHVVGPAGTHPIVVLMGCKTGLPNADVLGFVPWLTQCGASAVVSTLAPVLGRYAGPALAKLVRVLGEKRGQGTLGEAVLEAKRQMIADGEPIGMCLVTYGEADLRL